MLLFLLTMTVSAIICVFLILGYLQNRRSSSAAVSSSRARKGALAPATPWFVLERPRCWAAIRSRNLRAVQDALGLANATTCSWMEGLVEAASGNRLFVSPPVSGWILVFGPHLPMPSADVDRCFRFVMNLSAALGEVQYFCGNSITCEHAWARAIYGKVVRGYAWHGETLWNQGEFSDAERKTGMAVFPYSESPDAAMFGAQDVYQRNAAQIFNLAGRWSVDPVRIRRAALMSPGLSGEMSRSRML